MLLFALPQPTRTRVHRRVDVVAGVAAVALGAAAVPMLIEAKRLL